jgi:2-amino-4-hydroxy-6-hydroxymethyldihydropteridine diphosphokinase
MNGVIRAYIGIGSNLGDPEANVRAGAGALRRLADSILVAASSLYRTAPIGITDQPDFINAVVALDTRLAPRAMLQGLHAIERIHGRTRSPVRGGPRSLDLDLLLYGELRVVEADITLPHPRLHERAFVLVPLHEIAPMLEIPGRGSVAALLAGCAGQSVTRVRDVALQSAVIE